ncbi:cytochrome c [Alteromonas sediminis]|uniref:Cytochrome c n=1 Tax=Alteromonas sediminis TaxID=2259342 RepID=A0A3N5YCS5_9ALTE|nr:cytochrome c [Alteromonas sediminis]RPJ67135.1 cytochrome c [Alteromonas sediminis]
MKKMFKVALLSAALVVPAAGVSLHVHAQEATSEKQAGNVITFRQSLFQLIRSNMGPLGAMARGQMPFDEAVMAKNAERLTQLAAMVPDYMAVDTTKFNDGSDAKADIWQNRDDFNKKAQALYDASAGLLATVEAKDTDSYRKAIGAVGASCKACHDDYKAD